MITPGKKVIALAIICAASVGAILIGRNSAVDSKTENRKQIAKKSPEDKLFNILSKEGNKDSDGDGLEDWEEVLWKTDPNKADTDTDGTPDGEETKLKRDPTKPGPDDLLNLQPAKNTSGQEGLAGKEKTTNEDTTVTGIVGRDILRQVIEYKQLGLAFDASSIEQISSGVLNTVFELNLAKEYTIKDIKVKNTNGPKAAREYGNTVGEILVRHSPEETNELEIQIFARAVEQKSYQELEKINEYINSYDSVIKELLQTEAPKSAVLFHIRLLNSLSAIKSASEGMKNFERDSFKAALSAKSYGDGAVKFRESVQEVIDYTDAEGVLFGKTEGGYALQQILATREEVEIN